MVGGGIVKHARLPLPSQLTPNTVCLRTSVVPRMVPVVSLVVSWRRCSLSCSLGTTPVDSSDLAVDSRGSAPSDDSQYTKYNLNFLLWHLYPRALVCHGNIMGAL